MSIDHDVPRTVRGRIVMLVDNGVRGDSRVQKEAAAAAEAGWEVILLGRTTDTKEERWQIGQAEVRLVPMPEVLNRRRNEHRRPLWLRYPLAYPPNGIGDYHARRVAAWRADLTAKFAELESMWHTNPAERRRLARRRTRLRIESLAAKARGRWVSIRRGQLAKVNRQRRRRAGWWPRMVARFWFATMGDQAWRRLEPRLWEFELAFGKVIDRLRPDIIHANDFYMLGVGARAVLRARHASRRVALVWDAHELLSGLKSRSVDIQWLAAHIAYEREYSRYADAAITVSPELAEELQKAHGLPERPTVVLNAPDVDSGAGGEAPRLREVCGVGPDTPLLVYSGATAPQRGLDTMIEAMPHMPDVHVALVVQLPPAKYVQELVTKAESLGVSHRLHLAPYVPYDQVVAYLSGADVGVIPIHKYPNHEIALITKYFEYAHARLPMVVSDVRAMANATREIGCGEVFRAQDVEDYVRAVKLVLADPARYRAAYDRPGVLETWTWRAQAAVLDQVYSRFAPARPRLAAGELPHVTVIVAVRNAMPHLVRNIRSLLDQTLGMDAFEVIAVDDGSTDGSGARLDSFARLHPENFRVVHRRGGGQGPAPVYNAALEMARGRYVTFVGAGDTLGPEALDRMLTAADEYGSDVLAMRLVGVNGRVVPVELFTENRAEVPPFEPELSMALSSAMLFRRQLIEDAKLRFPDDVSVGSDLVFALDAIRHAKRVSVLADYDYYFAIARSGMGAATRTTPQERLRAVEQVIQHVAERIPAGPDRDTVLRRLFSVEIPQLLDSLPTAKRDEQEAICAGVGQLATTYLTDELASRLATDHRVRARLAQHGRLGDLLAVIEQDASDRPAPIVARDGSLHLGYACFDRPDTGLPAGTFQITHDLARQVAARIEVTSLRWDKDTLVVLAASPFDLSGHDPQATVRIGRELASVTVEAGRGPSTTQLRVTVAIDRLLAEVREQGERRDAILTLRLGDSTGWSPLRVGPRARAARRFVRTEYGRMRISATRTAAGALIVNYAPVTTRRVVGKILRILLRRG